MFYKTLVNVHWFVFTGRCCVVGGLILLGSNAEAYQVSVLEDRTVTTSQFDQVKKSNGENIASSIRLAVNKEESSIQTKDRSIIRKVSSEGTTRKHHQENPFLTNSTKQNKNHIGRESHSSPSTGIVFLANKPKDTKESPEKKNVVHPVPAPPKNQNGSVQSIEKSEPEPKISSRQDAKSSTIGNQRRCQEDRRNPFRLYDQKENGLRLGGWVSAGWYQQETGLFNQARRQRVQWNQVWFFAEKQIQTDHFDMTLRGDIVFGQDAQRFQGFGNTPFGTANDWDNSLDHGSYGWAIPQFYSDIHYANGKIRSGHFLSPFGYENGPAVGNFFYTHTFSYTNSQPHTLTGVLVDHQLSEKTGVYGGYTYGWDSAFDDAGDAGIFGFTHRTDSGIAITYNTSFGRLGLRGNGYYQNLSAAYQVSDRLQVAVESTWLDTNTVEEFGVASYGIFKINDCWSAGTRAEYWRSEATGSSTQTSVHSYTYGLNYRPHQNIVMRPEIRTDYGNAAVADGSTGYAFDVVITF